MLRPIKGVALVVHCQAKKTDLLNEMEDEGVTSSATMCSSQQPAARLRYQRQTQAPTKTAAGEHKHRPIRQLANTSTDQNGN